MEDWKKQKTFFEKLKEVIPLVTPLLMFSAIAFTYFTYFFDVHKTPQLIIENSIHKEHETDDYYIIKILLKIKNKSKTRVDIIANLGKLYGYKCQIKDNYNDTTYLKYILDTTSQIEKNSKGSSIELHRNITWLGESLIGFYQPVHNASWLVPEEIMTQEIITAVPKSFDVVYYYYMIDFTDDEKNIFSRYLTDNTGDVEYQLYKVEGNDSITLHELNLESEEDIKSMSNYNIFTSGSQYVAWLNTNKSALDSLQKNDANEDLLDDEFKKE